MTFDLSEQSQEALAQVISGGSANDAEPPIGLYRTAWKIRQFMHQFGVDVATDGRSRLVMTREAISQVAARDDGGVGIAKMIEKAADPRDFINKPDVLQRVTDYLNSHLVFDRLKLVVEGTQVRLRSASGTASVTEAVAATVTQIDFDTVQRDLDRALGSAEHDPEDAVTAACSVVESVCRSILIELSLGLPSKKDIQGLYQAVREPLGLSPSKEGVPDLIADDVRTILGGLNSIVNGIGALRTHGGDAHGRERGYRRIDRRIAKLSIHSASTIALFLIETWQMKFPDRTLAAH